jgi:NADH-ubiquinone oxidoreductase chain 5
MEGPTPVSALIHAATLVTAGVYLMLRSSPMLEYGSTALVVTAWLGAATAFYAATCGLLVSDAKRVIAFSTCSQLGYMMMAVGISQYHVGLYHLVTHACFKSLLFLAAGSVIHAMADQQDLRRVGGLGPLLPFTYVAMLVGSLSLMALPGMTGFYSKDHILELAAGAYTFSGHLVYWVGTISAGLTAFYSIRLLMLVFFSNPNGPRQSYAHTHEAPFLLGAPLVFLAVLSIVFGYVAKDLWLGMGTDYLASALPQHPANVVLVEAEFAVPVIIKMLPLIITLFGATMAVLMYASNMRFALSLTETSLGKIMYGFINGQWRWNAAITGLVIQPFMSLGYIVSKVLDRGVVEKVGPQGLSTLLTQSGTRVASFDTSVVTTYALYIVIGFVSLVLLLLAPHVLPGIAGLSDVGLVLLFMIGLGLLPSSR